MDPFVKECLDMLVVNGECATAWKVLSWCQATIPDSEYDRYKRMIIDLSGVEATDTDRVL